MVYAKIPSQEAFEWLWENEFFSAINEQTGSFLDDYEEDELPSEHTAILLEINEQYLSRKDAPEQVVEFGRSLAQVCQQAMRVGHPTFFIL